MSARILDGKAIRDQILAELKPRVQKLSRPPGLAVVLVGDDPASAVYVRNKVRASEILGLHSEKITPAADLSTEALLAIVNGLNKRPEIDGILVQMPLPSNIDSRRILVSVLPEKDVDGFHPWNSGNLMANVPGPRPCTPSGIIELLKRYQIPMVGKHAVVVGRSDIVGKPMALLLLHENATVTICHSKTAGLAEECRRADILVAAIGRARMIKAEFIKPGASVIDVGMNRMPDGKLTGDVDPDAAMAIAGAFTPVPGGVGPLTIAMLMSNTVSAAERRLCSR